MLRMIWRVREHYHTTPQEETELLKSRKQVVVKSGSKGLSLLYGNYCSNGKAGKT